MGRIIYIQPTDNLYDPPRTNFILSSRWRQCIPNCICVFGIARICFCIGKRRTVNNPLKENMIYQIKMKTEDGRLVDAILRHDGRPALFDAVVGKKMIDMMESEDSNEYSLQLADPYSI